MTEPTEIDTLVRKWFGCQPSSATFRIICAANFGVAAVSSTSAPEAFSASAWLSIVASVTSYEAVTTWESNLQRQAGQRPYRAVHPLYPP